MKRFLVLISVLLLLAVACKPNLQSGAEGDFAVLDDDSADIFEQIDALEEQDGEVEAVVDALEEDTPIVKTEPVAPVPQAVQTESDVYKVTVNEGELVKVDLNVEDPDGDKLAFTYEKPLDENGQWQTKMGDDGKYYTTVTVSDGANKVAVDVLIEVLSVNEDPVLAVLDDVTVNEGETVKLSPKATDADGDELAFTYSGAMTSDTWKTGYDDAGSYKVTVTVFDGNGGQDSQAITVEVKDVNRAPVIKGLE